MISSNSDALENYFLTPQEGAFLTYFKDEDLFRIETTKYKYVYEILIGRKNNACHIAAVHEDLPDNHNSTFFECEILKNLDDLLIVSKNPVINDPYQEFYFLYLELKMGFMVIGKANDGFSKNIPIFPDASVAAIPLKIKVANKYE